MQSNFPSAADSGVVPFHFIENGTPGRRWRAHPRVKHVPVR